MAPSTSLPDRVFVADSESKAQDLVTISSGRTALSASSRANGCPARLCTVDVAGIRRLRAVSKPFDSQAYQEAQTNYQVVVGTPDQSSRSLRYVRDASGLATCACGP